MIALLLFLCSVSGYTITGPSGRPVEITQDAEGIISINATVDLDAFYAQGHVFAKERWWQLEVGRHVVSGTLSELLGEGAFEDDLFFRSMALLNVSAANYEVLSARTQNAIAAAVQGINAYYATVTTNDFPIEYDVYNLAKVAPATWKIEEAVASGVKILSFGLANGRGVQGSTGQLLAQGVSAATILATLEPRPFEPSVMGGLNSSAPGAQEPAAKRSRLRRSRIKHAKLGPESVDNLKYIAELGSKYHYPRASNNWVVSGEHTDTGSPILCNDPHLHFQTPSLWMLMRIYSPEFTAMGASLPLGLPGFPIGANKDIAWGYTNVMSLEQQLFAMQTRQQPSGTYQYYYKGAWKDFEVREEVFNVTGTIKTISQHYSVYGPVVGSIEAQPVICFWWTGLLANDTSPDAALTQGYASNHDEWLAAMSLWGSANQNGIFADSSNIAYHTVGILHERLPGDSGQLPLPGDGSMDFFDREIPFDNLPQLLNPDRGYIFSANNRILQVGQTKYTEFPQFDGLISGFRAQRIGELIQAQIDANQPITVDFMASIQGDRTTLFKQWLQPTMALVDTSALSSEQQARFSALQAWDGLLSLDAVQGPVFELFQLCLKNATYFDLKGNNVFWLDIQFTQTYLTSNQCPADWNGMSCGDYVTACFQEACREVPDSTSWGSVHDALFAHVTPTGPLSHIFDRTLPYGGSPDTPFAADGGRTSTAGPSYRQIVSMGNRSASQWIMPMGNSGDPKSPFFDNLLQKWADVEYLPMNL